MKLLAPMALALGWSLILSSSTQAAEQSQEAKVKKVVHFGLTGFG